MKPPLPFSTTHPHDFFPSESIILGFPNSCPYDRGLHYRLKRRKHALEPLWWRFCRDFYDWKPTAEVVISCSTLRELGSSPPSPPSQDLRGLPQACVPERMSGLTDQVLCWDINICRGQSWVDCPYWRFMFFFQILITGWMIINHFSPRNLTMAHMRPSSFLVTSSRGRYN